MVVGTRPSLGKDFELENKRGMQLRGRRVGNVRPPMLPLTEEVDQLVKNTVEGMRFES